MCIALIKAWGLVVNIGTEKGAFSLVTEQHVSFQWCRIIIILLSRFLVSRQGCRAPRCHM